MIAGRPGDDAAFPLRFVELQNEVQRALANFYKDLQTHQPDDNVVVVDGSRSIDEVHELVYATVKKLADTPPA